MCCFRPKWGGDTGGKLKWPDVFSSRWCASFVCSSSVCALIRAQYIAPCLGASSLCCLRLPYVFGSHCLSVWCFCVRPSVPCHVWPWLPLRVLWSKNAGMHPNSCLSCDVLCPHCLLAYDLFQPLLGLWEAQPPPNVNSLPVVMATNHRRCWKVQELPAENLLSSTACEHFFISFLCFVGLFLNQESAKKCKKKYDRKHKEKIISVNVNSLRYQSLHSYTDLY